MTLKEAQRGGVPDHLSPVTEVKGKKRVDKKNKKEVKLSQSPATAVTPTEPPAQLPAESLAQQEKKNMAEITLTLNTKQRKSTRLVIFDSSLNSVQFLRTAFGATIPQTLTISGEGFAEPKAKVDKVKETPEERKARLASLPKLTLAEQVAKAEERATKLREKLAKAGAAPATM